MNNTLPEDYQSLIWNWTWERLKTNRLSDIGKRFSENFTEWSNPSQEKLTEAQGADSDIPIYTGSLALIVNALQYSPTIIIQPGAVPATPVEGMIYFDSTTKHFIGYDGTTWKQLDN